MKPNTNQTFKLWAGLFLAICFVPQMVLSNVHSAVLQVPETKNIITIDGVLNESEYAGFAKINNYLVWTFDEYVPDKLETYIAFDKEYIYIAFKGYIESNEAFLRALEAQKERDSHLWGRHHFQVVMSYPKGYALVMGGPTNSLSDFKNGDIAWNGNWQFKASIDKKLKFWSGEFKIPFADVDIDKTPYGETWDMSFIRSVGNQNDKKENFDITGLDKKSLAKDDSFMAYSDCEWQGKIMFVKKRDVICKTERWENQYIGENKLGFSVENTTGKETEITAETEFFPLAGRPEFVNQTGLGYSNSYELDVKGEPIRNSTRIKIPPGGKLGKTVAYYFNSEGNYFANVLFKNSAGEVIQRENGYTFTITPNKTILKECLLNLGVCESLCENSDNQLAVNLLQTTRKLEEECSSLLLRYPENTGSDKWNNYSMQVSSFETGVLRHFHRIKAAASYSWEQEPDFGLTTTGPMLKIRKDQYWNPQFSREINLSGAKNEYESFQIVILPLNRNNGKYKIETNDFRNGKGDVIAKNNIALMLVDYNLIPWQPNYIHPGKGWYPDPLIPFENSVDISSSDLCRPVWVNCYVPKTAAPGLYQSIFKVTDENGKTQSILVKLNVRNFELPTAKTLKTHTWDDMELLCQFYDVKELPVDYYLNMCDVLLKNNMSPGFAGVNYVSKTPDKNGKYDFSKVEKVLDYCMERGLNQFSMLQMKKGEPSEVYKPGELEQEYDFIKNYAGFLRKKGYLNKAVVEIWDEPTELQYLLVKERAQRIRSISPDIRTQLFADPGQKPYMFYDAEVRKEYGLYDLIDVWAPGPLIDAPKVRADGKEIWCYIATMARSTGPNLFIESPALNHRILPYYCWNANIDCFEHWNVNYFWRNVREGQPLEYKWPNVKWDSRTFHDFHGEGQLIYPGPEGKMYASIRLVNFRDGMDDYEYMDILKKLVDKHGDKLNGFQKANATRLLNVGEDLIKQYPFQLQQRMENTIKYPDQPEKLLDRRNEIAGLIEEINLLVK